MAKQKVNNFILIDLLEAFSKKEKEQFDTFVASAYFNTDQRVLDLLKALRRNILGKKTFNEVSQIQIYKEVFSDTASGIKSLTEQQQKLLAAKMSKLTKLVQRFLTIEALEKHPVYKIKLLNNQLLEKEQFSFYNRLYKKYKKQTSKQIVKGIEDYTIAFQIEKDRENYLHQKELLIKEGNYSELIDNLDKHYLLNKLDIWLTMQSIENATNRNNYNFDSFKALEPLLNLPAYSTNPLLLLYRNIIKLSTTKKEADYFYLLKLLERYGSTIPKNYLIDFYIVACNFCAHQIRIGNLAYKRKVFELYKIMDEEDIMIENKRIQVTKVKNIVAASCHVGEFNWATTFIHKYYQYTKKEWQKSVYHLNIGMIEFYKFNYKEAINHFIRVEKVNLAYDVDCRMILLKSYYLLDTEYDERTMQIFRSAERFIQTNPELPHAHKKSYKNFIQILINLYRVYHKKGKTTIEGIENKLEKMTYISDKQWLVEKIKEL